MTRKHFEKLASTLRNTKPELAEGQWAMARWVALVRDIAAICADDNPDFQRDKFFDACDLERPKAAPDNNLQPRNQP